MPLTANDLFHRTKLIDNHGHDHLLHSQPKGTETTLKDSSAAGLSPIAVSPLQGQYLALQCRMIKAQTVLEIGTLGGYSSIWFASSGAKVTSIEIDEKSREVALKNVRDAGLGEDKVEILLGSALDVMPKLKEEGQVFDLVFVDAAWQYQWNFFELALGLVRSGGVIIVDNVVRNILEDVDEKGEEAGLKGSLLEKVGSCKEVTATLVPTLSSHKSDLSEMYDGFVLAIKD